MTAPLGVKGCRFDAVVRAYNSEGLHVAGDNAPQYSRDKNTGKPILSWDEGKTWIWLQGGDLPDSKVKKVKVSWTKIRT
jgi:hypothetical protein